MTDRPYPLLADERQWFKARADLDAIKTGRDVAFRTRAILDKDVMAVPNARTDSRLAETPLAAGPPFIRFYAGAPLTTPGGHNIGALCVIDPELRPDGTAEDERRDLAMLARIVIARLEARRIERARMAESMRVRRAVDRLGDTDWTLDACAQRPAELARDGAARSHSAAEGMARRVSAGRAVDCHVAAIASDIMAATNAELVHGTVDGLSVHTTDTGSVTAEIAAAARKTQILAVNASIEAGRAGRGSAVIATKVPAFAASTDGAILHIGKTSEAVKQAVAPSVERCDAMSSRMESTSGRTREVKTAVRVVAGIHDDLDAITAEIAAIPDGVGEQAETVTTRPRSSRRRLKRWPLSTALRPARSRPPATASKAWPCRRVQRDDVRYRYRDTP